jgi:LmbE family N-acetylglucosaminyl deacetylase
MMPGKQKDEWCLAEGKRLLWLWVSRGKNGENGKNREEVRIGMGVRRAADLEKRMV